jgi:hypothetical protein
VNPKFSREDVISALRDNEYVASDSIRFLLEREPFMDWGATGGARAGKKIFLLLDISF